MLCQLQFEKALKTGERRTADYAGIDCKQRNLVVSYVTTYVFLYLTLTKMTTHIKQFLHFEYLVFILYLMLVTYVFVIYNPLPLMPNHFVRSNFV